MSDYHQLKHLNANKYIEGGLACGSKPWQLDAYADATANLHIQNSIMCGMRGQGRDGETLFVFRDSFVVTFFDMLDYFMDEFSTYEIDTAYRELKLEKRTNQIVGETSDFEVSWDALWSLPRGHSTGSQEHQDAAKLRKAETGFWGHSKSKIKPNPYLHPALD